MNHMGVYLDFARYSYLLLRDRLMVLTVYWVSDAFVPMLLCMSYDRHAPEAACMLLRSGITQM